MAIYHLSMKIIGGGSGRTAIGAAAYHRGEKLYNQNDGITHDYTKRRGAVSAAAYRKGDELFDGKNTYDFTNKKGIAYNEIMLPAHAPREYLNSQTLWNTAQNAEKQHNSRTAREIVIALPNELTTEQQIELIRDYIKRNFVDEGMCVDFSIHAGHIHTRKGEIYPFEDLAIQRENPHVHIQLTVRPLNEDGTFCKTKTRKEYILDKNGERIRTKSGKGWVSRNVGLTDWDKTETLLKWREDWAITVNKEFERLGIDERISHLSLKEQGIDREPTKHMGHEAWNLEKKGIKTEIGNENRAIMTRNKALEPLKEDTRKDEPSTREKLASIRDNQGINHESTTHITPENTAEYMHELKQAHVIFDMEIAEINTKISDIHSENNAMRVKAEEIEERAEEIQTLRKRIDELNVQRQGMGIFKSKKAINEQIKSLKHSYVQAEDYFKETYFVTPEESASEIKRLEQNIKSKEHFQEQLQDKLTSLIEEKEAFKLEYHKQKLLAEANPDKQIIQDRLKGLATTEYMHDKHQVSEIHKRENEEFIKPDSQNEYKSIDNELYEISEKHREVQRLNNKANDMLKYSTQVRNQHGREYFKRLFGVDLEMADTEIQRIRLLSDTLKREVETQEKTIAERENLIKRDLIDKDTEDMTKGKIREYIRSR